MNETTTQQSEHAYESQQNSFESVESKPDSKSRTVALIWDEFEKTILLCVIPGDLRSKNGLVVCNVDRDEAYRRLFYALGASLVNDVYKVVIDGKSVNVVGRPLWLDSISDNNFFSWITAPEFKVTRRSNTHFITASVLKIDTEVNPWLVNKAQEDLRLCFAKFLERLFSLDLQMKAKTRASESETPWETSDHHENLDQMAVDRLTGVSEAPPQSIDAAPSDLLGVDPVSS